MVGHTHTKIVPIIFQKIKESYNIFKWDIYLPKNELQFPPKEFDAPIKLSNFGCSKIGVHFREKKKERVK